MESLYQKHHGKPGIGVQGLPGERGKYGKAVYIGFINEFFDSTDIPVNTIVKMAQRKINAQEYNDYYKEFAQDSFNSYNAFKTANDASLEFMPTINLSTFENTANALYYTGRTQEFDSADPRVYDIMDNYQESNYVYKNTHASTGAGLTDSYQFNYIYNIKQCDKDYLDLYDDINDPKYNVQIDVSHITFEPQDVVKIFGGYHAYNSPIYGANTFNVDNDDIMRYFAYIKTTGTTTANQKWWDESATIANSDTGLFYEKRSFDVNSDSANIEESFTDYYNPDNDSDSSYLDASNYAMGVDSHYAIYKDSSTKIFGYDELENNRKYKLYIDNNLPTTEADVFDFLLTQYIHTSSYTKPPIALPDAMTDDYGYTHMSLDMYDPSIRSTLDSTKEKFDMESVDSILASKQQETLKEFARNYKYITKDFINRYEITLQKYKVQGNIHADDAAIRWSANEEEKISVPTTLSGNYRVGDILYFYTDKQKFVEDGEIAYMVTLTEDLLKCDINTLIRNAKIVDPFKYQTVFSNADRLVIYDNVNILKNNNQSTAEENYYMRSFGNIISDKNESAVLVASKFDSSGYYNNLLLETHPSNISQQLMIKSEMDNGMPVYTITADTLKLNNLYMRDDILLTNLESQDVLYDKNLRYSDNQCIYAPDEEDLQVKVNIGDLYNDGNFYPFNTYVFKFGKNKFINDKSVFADYQVGYIVYANNEIIKDKLFSNTDDYFSFELDPITDTGFLDRNLMEELEYSQENGTDIPSETIAYNILAYIRRKGGFNIYSHTTQLICRIEYRDRYKLVQPDYMLTVDNDIQDIIKPTTAENNIIFSISGITVDKTPDGQHIVFDISTDYPYVQNNKENPQTIESGYESGLFIEDVYFNNTKLVVNCDKCSWGKDNPEELRSQLHISKGSLTAATITWLDISIGDVSTICEDPGHKVFHLYVLDNIPDITYNNGITQKTDTVADFMMTFNDDAMTNSDAFDYNRLFGFSNSGDNIQCVLFDRIMDNMPVSMAKPRKLNVAVRYRLKNSADDLGTEYFENYEIVQPGFTDPRTLPQVSLHLHTDINELESYNTINSGILCNQFQTFMDINISNFDYDSWGKYIGDESDALLNLRIKNVHNDLDWQESLQMSQIYTRSTLKIFPDDQAILTDGNSIQNYNNCIKFTIKVFTNTFEQKTLNNLTQADIDELTQSFSDKCTVDIKHYINGKEIEESSGNIINGYIVLSDDICKDLINPAYIVSGIFEDITINLNRLTIKEANTPIYAQIMLEMGNPVIMNMYLQFAVTWMQVMYKNPDYDSSQEEGPDNREYVTFSTYADQTNLVDTYLHKADNYKETYTFISEKLEMNINPVSLIACPPEKETSLVYLSGSVKKTGSEDQIQLGMKFFGNNLYNNSDIVNITNAEKNRDKKISFEGLNIKYKHLQDNVKYISFSTLDITDSYGKVSNNYIYSDYESILTDRKQYDALSNKNYLSVIYHSTLMNPKLRDDQRTFYYNDKLYMESKYDQFSMEYPVFISQTHDWEIRPDDVMDAIDTWNFEYQSQQNIEKNSKVFPGIINNYGNGYMYLSDDVDKDMYFRNNIMSLADTKKFNMETLYDKSDYFDIGTPSPINIYTPSQGKYFRVPLYHINWEYPVYNGTNIKPYYIISLFDYMIINNYNKHNTTANMSIVNKFGLANEECNNIRNNIIPYNILFNISPKILFNDDTGTINILMLRCPTIEDDTDLTESHWDCYILNNRYYNTIEPVAKYMPKSYSIPT